MRSLCVRIAGERVAGGDFRLGGGVGSVQRASLGLKLAPPLIRDPCVSCMRSAPSLRSPASSSPCFFAA
jgi:hypothetical protein